MRGATQEMGDMIASKLNAFDDWGEALDSMQSGPMRNLAAQMGVTTDEAEKIVHALANLDDVAAETHVADVASQFLAVESTLSPVNEGLIRQAEALTGVSRNSADAMTVVGAYLQLLQNGTQVVGGMTLAQEDLVKSGQGLPAHLDATADSVGDLAPALELTDEQLQANADAADRLATTIKTNQGYFSELTAAADQLDAALQSLVGGQMSAEQANRAVADGMRGIAEQVAAAKKEHDAYATSLNMATATGSRNRAQIQAQAQAILEQASANVANGDSMEDAASKAVLYTADLKNQLVALAFNRDEVDAYIASLGLTPDNVVTAVKLAHDQLTLDRISELQEGLDDVDAGASAEVQALIDEGRLPEALRTLELINSFNGKVVNPTASVKLAMTSGGLGGLKMNAARQLHRSTDRVHSR